MLQKYFFIIPALIISMIGCNPKTDKNDGIAEGKKDSVQAMVARSDFGKLADGTAISLFTMTNIHGVEVKVMNYGGIITSIVVPDRNGKMGDIVLGYDSVGDYVKSNPYFGSLIGRYGNRIANGKFTLGGKQYTLATNNGKNHLHGGIRGFDKVVWNIEPFEVKDGAALRLSYTSPDMEEGYPGTLTVKVEYTLTNDDELRFWYQATTDKQTIVNLTQHTYFNLNEGSSDILSHKLELTADKFLPVDQTLIPTGELKPVVNTPFDFRTSKTIGSRINEADTQLKFGQGYDHCWALNKSEAGLLTNAAVVYDSVSGREVTVMTTEPGIQFYSGNFLDGSNVGKGGIVYKNRFGFCLETQHFPDSPNRPSFPSVTLGPGQTYGSETVYKFAVR